VVCLWKSFEYHNGSRRGCVWVLEGVKLGGGFEKSIGNQRSQVWKKLNDHKNVGSDSRYEKQFPKLADVFNQTETFEGFDFKEWQADTLNYCEVDLGPFCLENLCGFGGSRQAGRRVG